MNNIDPRGHSTTTSGRYGLIGRVDILYLPGLKSTRRGVLLLLLSDCFSLSSPLGISDPAANEVEGG
ncbi:20096_t:CDS:2 [Racocetra fulgida]|uniref:20096_t:CDS:1 n=1 Tax=Racocetra fulgida TaxID=60492 RepID=A0A9N8YYF4_9GLOM|nr:20096_t:CDS:2 [Racocetra fulgida]